jgi:hypothetical protein
MDIRKLNSATKYPSILTYHELGDKGRLTPTIQVPFPAGQTVYVTEKVDGTNGRIVILPPKSPITHFVDRRYLIGSREEFLFAQCDLIYPPDYGIVDALKPVADGLPGGAEKITVYFFEVYGGDLPASKQYTNSKAVSIRIFDVARVPLAVLEKPIEQISSWREHGGQEFLTEQEINAYVRSMQDFPVSRVPQVGTDTALPATVQGTYDWLKNYEKSQCDLGGGKGRAEGVVVRSEDRKCIAKIRFEDYERTLDIRRKS